jgi:hypothetical protein
MKFNHCSHGRTPAADGLRLSLNFEPLRSENGLNGGKRLNGLNVLNEPQY